MRIINVRGERLIMIYKLRKKLEEQRRQFSGEKKLEYIVRRYDIKGNVIEDIIFEDAYHAGLLKKALRAARTPFDCSIIRREYDINKTDEGSFDYIAVEKYV